MHAEPSHDADGSVSAWHFWRGADLVATLERLTKTSWRLKKPNGSEQIYLRRRDALAAIRAMQ